MSPPDKKLVLSVEQGVSATSVQPSSFTTVSGYVDYAVVVTVVDDAGELLNRCSTMALLILCRGIPEASSS
jgi:hypothetical protein